jgi:hypothetical protein
VTPVVVAAMAATAAVAAAGTSRSDMRYFPHNVPPCVHRLELGAYLIGITTAVERARIGDHLAECAECRCELNELAPVIALLASAAPWL